MKSQNARPEDRRRSAEPAPWADTLPDYFRSEGFAEDLPHTDTNASPTALGDPRAWLNDAMLPMLGLALAGVLGLFAR